MRSRVLFSMFLTGLLVTCARTAKAEGESGCELLPDARVACDARFMVRLAEGYQNARGAAAICELRLGECRTALDVPPPTPAEPPVSPLVALGVGGAAGAALAAGVAVLAADGPLELGVGLAAAGLAAGAGAAVLTW